MSYQDQGEAFKNKVAGMVNDASDRAADLADRASRQGEQVRRQAMDTASDLAHRANDALSEYGVDANTVSGALDSFARSLRGVVRDRPIGALAVTAVIGLVIGAMTSR